MSRQAARITVTLAVALAAMVAGCGDDAESDAFADEVGAICEDARGQFTEANQDVVLRDDAALFKKEFREANAPIYEDYLAQLEEVEPPSDKADAYDEFITAIRAQSELILADPVAPLSAAGAEKETAYTRKAAELNEQAVAAGEEAGIPASCTGGDTSQPEGTEIEPGAPTS